MAFKDINDIIWSQKASVQNREIKFSNEMRGREYKWLSLPYIQFKTIWERNVINSIQIVFVKKRREQKPRCICITPPLFVKPQNQITIGTSRISKLSNCNAECELWLLCSGCKWRRADMSLWNYISLVLFSILHGWRNLNISIHSFSNPYRCIFAQKKVQT